VDLAGAQDPGVFPHRHARGVARLAPLDRLDHLRIGLPDKAAHPRQHRSAPVAEPGDLRVDLFARTHGLKSSPPTRSAKRQPSRVRTSLSVKVPTSGELALIAGSSPGSAGSPWYSTITLKARAWSASSTSTTTLAITCRCARAGRARKLARIASRPSTKASGWLGRANRAFSV